MCFSQTKPTAVCMSLVLHLKFVLNEEETLLLTLSLKIEPTAVCMLCICFMHLLVKRKE